MWEHQFKVMSVFCPEFRLRLSQSGCELPREYAPTLQRYIASDSAEVRTAASSALASAMKLHPSTIGDAIKMVRGGGGENDPLGPDCTWG